MSRKSDNRWRDYAQAVSYCERLLRPLTDGASEEVLREHHARMGYFLARLGAPQDAFPAVHVAGTSGKGSTTAMIGATLHAAGYRTGIHCTPYLQTAIERMQIGERYASPHRFAELICAMRPHIRHMQQDSPYREISYREVAVAQALLHFAQERVDIAAIETGMGGRYDYTNYVRSLVSAIVTVDYDHVATLGPTLARIAYHKAGIIKDGMPVVSGVAHQEAQEVVRREAAARQARLLELGRDILYTPRSVDASGSVFDYCSPAGTLRGVEVGMLGRHQMVNAAIAIAAVELLRDRGLVIGEEAIRRGVARARMPGRLEIVQRQPTVVLDGAHNPEKMRALVSALGDLFPGQRPVLVVGLLATKQADLILREVLRVTPRLILTSPHVLDKPAVEPDLLADLCRQLGASAIVEHEPLAAVARACNVAGAGGLVCITGSLYMVGQVRELWVPTESILSKRTSFP